MKSILFIGNSFTFFNDMPAMVQNICNFRHDQIHTAKLTYGGYYLDQYLQPRTDANDRLCSLLEGAGWDYVVLQDQSSCPAVETQRVSVKLGLSRVSMRHGHIATALGFAKNCCFLMKHSPRSSLPPTNRQRRITMRAASLSENALTLLFMLVCTSVLFQRTTTTIRRLPEAIWQPSAFRISFARTLRLNGRLIR